MHLKGRSVVDFVYTESHSIRNYVGIDKHTIAPQTPIQKIEATNSPSFPSKLRISLDLSSPNGTTPLGLVKTTACAKLANTVVCANPILNLPCNPRIIYFDSDPLARTNNDLILSTFHF